MDYVILLIPLLVIAAALGFTLIKVITTYLQEIIVRTCIGVCIILITHFFIEAINISTFLSIVVALLIKSVSKERINTKKYERRIDAEIEQDLLEEFLSQEIEG